MKKTLTLIAALLLTATTGFAQIINVHKTNGTIVSYSASEVDYVDFTAASTGHAPEGAEAVDLGLPSGTKWANMNIGAIKPEEKGDYFRWAETTPYKEGDTEESYRYTEVDLGASIAGTNYDAARANWGDQWKIPTLEQIEELMTYCSDTWTSLDGVPGVLATGPNGSSVFFPASGRRNCDDSSLLLSVGIEGYYWSATALGASPWNARCFQFSSGGWNWNSLNRTYGFSVRAVTE